MITKRSLKKDISDFKDKFYNAYSKLNSAVDAEHNRISVVAPRVDRIDADLKKLAQIRGDEIKDSWEQRELINSILGVLVRSGIIEEAVTGGDLFQMIKTVDTLQRYPLYKINKVVTE